MMILDMYVCYLSLLPLNIPYFVQFFSRDDGGEWDGTTSSSIRWPLQYYRKGKQIGGKASFNPKPI